MHGGPASLKRSSPAAFIIALVVSLLAVSMLVSCESNSPEGAVRKYLNAMQSGNWNAFKAAVVKQNLTEVENALAKTKFEQTKVKYQDIKIETKYDKNDKNKAAVVMTDGKVTITAKIGGEPQTQTMDIKKLEEPERTYDTVRINGVWLVETKL
jgi:hypothetical protein